LAIEQVNVSLLLLKTMPCALAKVARPAAPIAAVSFILSDSVVWKGAEQRTLCGHAVVFI